MNRRINIYTILLFVMFLPLLSFAQKSSYELLSIDSINLKMYNILKMKNGKEEIILVSEKSKEVTKGIKLDENEEYILEIKKIYKIKLDSTMYIGLDRGLFANDKLIFDHDDIIYISDCIKGKYYICE